MLSQKFSNCLLQLLRYKVGAKTYNNNILQNDQRNRASYTHDILSKLSNIPCRHFSQDENNLNHYVINNIRKLQNNTTPTFGIYEHVINNELKCLDYMQEQTQNFFNELINISLNDNYVFDNDFYNRLNDCLANDPINNDEKILLSLLIEIHIIRLFNNFYYKWVPCDIRFTPDIEYLMKNFRIIPQRLNTRYLQDLLTYVGNKLNNIDNVDNVDNVDNADNINNIDNIDNIDNNNINININNIRKFIEYLENMVSRYGTI